MAPQILGWLSVWPRFPAETGHDDPCFRHRALPPGTVGDLCSLRFYARVAEREIGDPDAVFGFVLDDPVDGLEEVAGQTGSVFANDPRIHKLDFGGYPRNLLLRLASIAADDPGETRECRGRIASSPLFSDFGLPDVKSIVTLTRLSLSRCNYSGSTTMMLPANQE